MRSFQQTWARADGDAAEPEGVVYINRGDNPVPGAPAID